MNKSINTFLADQNVIQSLEQQFDYLFKCAGVLGFKRAPHHNHYQ